MAAQISLKEVALPVTKETATHLSQEDLLWNSITGTFFWLPVSLCKPHSGVTEDHLMLYEGDLKISPSQSSEGISSFNLPFFLSFPAILNLGQ